MKTAIIDADSIIHIVAYHNAVPKQMIEMIVEGSADETENNRILKELYDAMDKDAVLAHVDSFLNDILNTTGATHYLGFVGSRKGSHTFRHDLAKTKPYKGNRPSSPHWVVYWKPIIIEHFVEKWGFTELTNIEADDACGICSKIEGDTIICSPDKDLKQLTGHHYDYKKKEFDFIEPEQGIKNLYTQCLVGDSVDNIQGCKGVGAKAKFLEFPNCNTLEDYHKYTLEVFKIKGQESIMQEQLDLVFMLRYPDGVDLKNIPTPIIRPIIGDITEEMEQAKEIDVPVPQSFTQ